MPKMTVLLLSVEPLVNISSDGSIPSTDAIDALDSLTSFWALVPYMCVRLSALPGVFCMLLSWCPTLQGELEQKHYNPSIGTWLFLLWQGVDKIMDAFENIS